MAAGLSDRVRVIAAARDVPEVFGQALERGREDIVFRECFESETVGDGGEGTDSDEPLAPQVDYDNGGAGVGVWPAGNRRRRVTSR